MAALKKKDLKNMSSKEMNERLLEAKKELMKLISQVRRGTPAENPGKIRSMKRIIARILTFQNQRGGVK